MNVSCVLTFNYLAKRQCENRSANYIQRLTENHKRYTCNDIIFIDVEYYVGDIF